MKCAAEVLDGLEVPYEATGSPSAHRTPDRMAAFAKGAEARSFDVNHRRRRRARRICRCMNAPAMTPSLPGSWGGRCSPRRSVGHWIACCRSCRCPPGSRSATAGRSGRRRAERMPLWARRRDPRAVGQGPVRTPAGLARRQKRRRGRGPARLMLRPRLHQSAFWAAAKLGRNEIVNHGRLASSPIPYDLRLCAGARAAHTVRGRAYVSQTPSLSYYNNT